MKKNVVVYNFFDYFVGAVCPIIGTILLIMGIFVAIVGTGIILRYMNYTSQLKTPAALYEIGEIVNDEYQVVATDSKNTLWLQKSDDDCTYVAVASSDYPNLTFSERIKWLWNKSLKESISIEITDNVGGKESENFE